MAIIQKQFIQPDDVADFDYAGIDAVVSGDGQYLISGSPTADHSALSNPGAAYIKELVDGAYGNETKLIAPDALAEDKFGHQVWLSGDGLWAFVAAHEQNTDVADGGAVYVWENVSGTWTYRQRIIPTVTPASGDKFGFSISADHDGSTLVISAPFEHNGGTDLGVIYVFTRSGSTFTQAAKLTASDAANNDTLGYAVFIAPDGLTIFGGATMTSSTGAVYIFKKGAGWSNATEDQKLIASDGGTFDYFGAAVNDFFVFGGTPITCDFDGSKLLIGAYGWDSLSFSSVGAVYYFKLNTGTGLYEEIQIISSRSIEQAFHYFGYSVSTDHAGLNLVISAQSDDSTNANAGRGFLFRFNGFQYVESASFKSDDDIATAFFSYRNFLTSDGKNLITTASDHDGSGSDEGAIYWIELEQTGDSVVVANHTEAEQAQSMANYLPGGQLFYAKNKQGTRLRNFLDGMAKELFRADNYLAVLGQEIIPDETQKFVDEWERVVGIPDSCFDGTGTIAQRRRNILIKLASLGVQTAEDFEALAALFGVTATVEAAGPHAEFPMEFPFLMFTGDDAKFTILVTFALNESNAFPLTFPAVLGDEGIGILECLFTKLKPANCDVVFVSTL